ncbi:WXG100-like domain-containing protein [Streptomyces sp. NPDC004376]
MGLVLPSIIDEALDLIGVNWPNVDEDDYFEMATSMRDFADTFEGQGGAAHKAVTRIIDSSEGLAVEAMRKHWSHVKTGHLDKIPDLARLFADACDGVGQIIRGMKVKAGVELGVLAGTIVAELAAAPLTLGISAAAAAGEIALMRTIVKRLVDEAVDQLVDTLVTKLTEPVTAKLQELISDMVLDLAEGSFKPGADPGGMKLASAGDDGDTGGSGGSGGGGLRTVIDHTAFEDGAGKVSSHGSDLGSQSGVHLHRSKSTFGKTKGKDVFTHAVDGFIEEAIDGMEKAAKKVTDHVTHTFPDSVKAASRHQKRKDHDIGDEVGRVEVKKPRQDGGSTPMYLLSDDGSIRRLHHDGTTTPVHPDDSSGVHGVLGDKAWYPWNHTGEKQRKDKPNKGETVGSTKVAPGSTELARATQLGRYANRTERPGSYVPGGNYASALYDGDGSRFILVGASGKAHSERSIGHPLIKKGHEGNVSHLYTERQPCQKNPKCERYLAREFPSHLDVTHSAKYDQSEKGPDGTELSKYKKDREHRAYVQWLEDQWKQHGVAGGRTDTVMDLSPSDRKFVP